MVPAAQYIRMSTEKQEYSIHNQSLAIADYAQQRHFVVLKTYSDAARSGLTLNRRHALRQLLSDVISGNHEYEAVLVYDVSRWGRFQDTDEPAHYEFVCRSAGVSVHYCAEAFENDCSLASSLMKSLKRSMAAEFSRELGVRVRDGKRKIVAAGFNVGGRVPFGFQRRIVSNDPERCRILEKGERKYVRSERLTLVHGPSNEVACVREIFTNVICRELSPREISRDLNQRGITIRGKRWTQELVQYVLSNPEYAGCCTWGRTSQRLGQRRVLAAPDQWILKADAFPPIVSREEYDRAQKLVRPESGRIFWTQERLLCAAKQLLESEGKITIRRFDSIPGFPAASTVRHANFPELCKLLGYPLPERFVKCSNTMRHTVLLHRKLLHTFVASFPNELSFATCGGWPRLLLDTRILVSLRLCRALPDAKGRLRWRMTSSGCDVSTANIVCLLDPTNSMARYVFVFPKISSGTWARQFGENDTWLTHAKPLERHSELCDLLRAAATADSDPVGPSGFERKG